MHEDDLQVGGKPLGVAQSSASNEVADPVVGNGSVEANIGAVRSGPGSGFVMVLKWVAAGALGVALVVGAPGCEEQNDGNGGDPEAVKQRKTLNDLGIDDIRFDGNNVLHLGGDYPGPEDLQIFVTLQFPDKSYQMAGNATVKPGVVDAKIPVPAAVAAMATALLINTNNGDVDTAEFPINVEEAHLPD